MRFNHSTLALCVFVLFAFYTSIARGEPLAAPQGMEFCTVCHGSQLQGNASIGAPRLSGLSAWYIEKQLRSFKNGWRGELLEDSDYQALSGKGHEMQTMVSELTDEQIIAVAQWASQTESPVPAASIQADVKEGEKLYKNCVACHQANGVGNKAVGAPALVGQNDWYVLRQLNLFRVQLRGNHPHDTHGNQMLLAANLIRNEQDAANLAAYIQQFKPSEGKTK